MVSGSPHCVSFYLIRISGEATLGAIRPRVSHADRCSTPNPQIWVSPGHSGGACSGERGLHFSSPPQCRMCLLPAGELGRGTDADVPAEGTTPEVPTRVNPYSVIDITPLQEEQPPPADPDVEEEGASPPVPSGYSVPVPCGYAVPCNLPLLMPAYSSPVVVRATSLDEEGRGFLLSVHRRPELPADSESCGPPCSGGATTADPVTFPRLRLQAPASCCGSACARAPGRSSWHPGSRAQPAQFQGEPAEAAQPGVSSLAEIWVCTLSQDAAQGLSQGYGLSGTQGLSDTES